MKAYYGSRFSPNMTRTPENYLICHNVPISRTGYYEYLGQELGLDEYRDQVIKVYRDPEEVFSNASIASFEGKPVTDEHPSVDVRPDNYTTYMKGIVTNVRKGTGEYEDCVVADLIIYDPKLQSEIETGKREVSCGYDCIYEGTQDGQYRQRQIYGNHVAVVGRGRAGNRVAIKDSESPNLKQERSMDMSKKPTNILMKMFTSFIKDAEPDEIEEAMKEIAGKDETKVEIGPTTNPTEFVKETETDEDGTIEDILQRLGDIETVLAKLVKTDEEVHAESASDELEELEKELQEDEELTGEEGETEEESVTISPEELSENLAEEEAEEEEEKPMTADSKQALLNTVKAMKPIVAAIADPFERKKATDALIKSVRGQMTSNDDSYAKMNKPKKNVVAKDSAADNREDFGKKCAARNPHIKGGK